MRDGNAIAFLSAHRLDGVLVHADNLVGLDDLQIQPLRVVPGELLLDGGMGADEQHARAKLTCRLHGAKHDLARSEIATHRVERDAARAGAFTDSAWACPLR